jgi:hypothetical protein
VECLARIYLNGYLPSLQVGGQVLSFMRKHLGIRSRRPAIQVKIGIRFQADVKRFAEDHSIPVVRCGRGDARST